MGTVRRFGPSGLAPEVSRRPEYTSGRAELAQTFESLFSSANEFIRPAVTDIQVKKGQQDALNDLENGGPQFELERTRDRNSTAIDLLEPGSQEADALAPLATTRQGPTRENAAIQRLRSGLGVGPPDRANAEILAGLQDVDLSGRIRDKPLSDQFKVNLSQVVSGLGPNIDVKVTSGGQDRKGHGHERTGSTRHDVDHTGHSHTADLVLLRDGKPVKPGDDPDLYEQFFAAASPHFPGMGHYEWGVHVGGGAPAFWGPDKNSASADPRFAEAAAAGRRGQYSAGPASVEVPQGGGIGDYEVNAINARSFEPKLPFTVRDEAYNKAADRVITSRANTAIDEGFAAAQARADGDLGKLDAELETLRTEIMGGLPDGMPGLKVELQETFERNASVAKRQAIKLGEQRIIQQQNEAMATALGSVKTEAERLALTGATGDELAGHLAQATDMLANFGPREGFSIAGREYPPDPSRAGTMTPDAIASSLATIGLDSRRVMIEAEFQKSAAPGQFVDELRRNIFAGNSPLPPGESLELLAKLETRARATESRRVTAANAEKTRLQREMDATINAYVEMSEAGVPVAIPQADRSAILGSLSMHPDLQREALNAFAVADAQVDTFGMSGPELMDYVEAVRGDMRGALDRGELDLEGAAVIESLEDVVKKAQDAVSSETVGLSAIQQMTRDGMLPEDVDWDGLRDRAAGKSEVLEAINETEAFHNDIASISGLSATERDQVLEQARASLVTLAAAGGEYGSGAARTEHVLDKLEQWSEHRAGLAENDPMKFAASEGIAMAPFTEAENMADVGQVLVSRVQALQPRTMAEGVENPVPLNSSEVEAIVETYEAAPRSDKAAFLGVVTNMGRDQAEAVFRRVGASSPNLFAAGMIFAGGNQEAAEIIMRGSSDLKLEGGSSTVLAATRANTLGSIMENDLLTGESMVEADAVALAYARGKAIAAGKGVIEPDALSDGYKIALGKQPDGTGGPVSTSYGHTIAPPGWTSGMIDDAIGDMTDEQLTQAAKGMVLDRFGRVISAKDLKNTIEILRPSDDDPFVYIPMDREGGVFMSDTGSGPEIFMLDVRELQ